MVSDGVCLYPFQKESDTFGLRLSCPVWTKKAQIGCIDYMVWSETDCLNSYANYGTPKWIRPATNKSECLAYGKE